MANNPVRAAGERNRNGEGPQVICAGTRGAWLRHDEPSANWPVWPSMSSITRLRVMSYLCQHGRTRTVTIARTLGAPGGSVRAALWGLKSTWAVSASESPVERRNPCSRGGFGSIDWSVTDTGRRWLWRYGWVTRRIGWDLEWQHAGYDGRLDVMPYDVLREHAEPSLLLPTSLALMHYLTRCPPEQTATIAERCGFSYFVAHKRLHMWWRLGWVEKTQCAVEPRSYFSPDCVTESPRWVLTERGKQAVERHTAALRWASQTAGYTPPPDDPFFNDGA